jgi:hypothetical protein
MKNILLQAQPRSKVPAKLSGPGRFRCRKGQFEVVDDAIDRLVVDDEGDELNVKLDDVFVLEDVVAVDHLALVFGFAPDAGILQLPGKIQMNGLGHVQDR